MVGVKVGPDGSAGLRKPKILARAKSRPAAGTYFFSSFRWPRGSPCAKPWALVAGKPGARFAARVDYHAGRRHLPVVSLYRAA